MSSETKSTVAEMLYYALSQSKECNEAFLALDREYDPKYEKFTRTMDYKACVEFELIIAANCSEYGSLGFKLGVAAALNIKSELAEVFGAMLETKPDESGVS